MVEAEYQFAPERPSKRLAVGMAAAAVGCLALFGSLGSCDALKEEIQDRVGNVEDELQQRLRVDAGAPSRSTFRVEIAPIPDEPVSTVSRFEI